MSSQSSYADLINESMNAIKTPQGADLFKKYFYDSDYGLGGNAVGDSIMSYNNWVTNVLERQFEMILNTDFTIGGYNYRLEVGNITHYKSALTVPEAVSNSANLSAQIQAELTVYRYTYTSEDDTNPDVDIVGSYTFSPFDIPVMVGSVLETLSHDPDTPLHSDYDEKLARIQSNMSTTGAKGYFVRDGSKIVLLFRDQLRNNLPITQIEKANNKQELTCRYTSADSDFTHVTKLHHKKRKGDDPNDFTRISLTIDLMDHNTAMKRNEMIHVGTVLRYLADMCNYTYSEIPSLVSGFASPDNQRLIYSIALSISNGEDPEGYNTVRNTFNRKQSKPLTDEDLMEIVVSGMYHHIDSATENEYIIDEVSGEEVIVPTYYLYKMHTLCWQLAVYLETLTNLRPITDLDNWAYKRLAGPAFKLQYFATKALTTIRRKMRRVLDKDNLTESTLMTTLKASINSKMSDSLTTNIFGNISPSNSNDSHDDHYVEYLESDTSLKEYTHLTRIKAPSHNRAMEKPRFVRMEQVGYVCPVHTPENDKCGITKHKALGARVSHDHYYEFLKKQSIIEILQSDFQETFHSNFIDAEDRVPLCLNGMIIGHVPIADYEVLRQAKLEGTLPYDSMVFMSEVLEVYTDSFRPVRPLLTVKDKQPLIETDNAYHLSWPELLQQGYVEYVDVREAMHYVVAPLPQDIEYAGSLYDRLVETGRNISGNPTNRVRNAHRELQASKATHAELDPMLMFGVSAAHIPMANMNQSARNLYQSNMGKQAVAGETPPCRTCTDDYKVLHNPVPPLFQSAYEDILGVTAPGTGEQVVLAINVAKGYNQEDSLVMSKSFVENGGFLYSKVTTVSHTRDQFEKFQLPDETRTSKKLFVYNGSKKRINPKYAAITEGTYDSNNNLTDVVVHNYPLVGSVIRDGDVVIPITRIDSVSRTDASIIANIDQRGVVEDIFFSKNTKRQDTIHVRIREVRHPTSQDKFALRAAQKGTVAQIDQEENMYWDPVRGVRADMVINPHAIPSRMTMSVLLEMVGGLSSSMSGVTFDATSFSVTDYVELERMLLLNGFTRSGMSTLYSGETGERLNMPIMMAPAYYQMLQHQVYDKRKLRGTGKVDMFRQPKKKRKIEGSGGVRIGEMERDAFATHGATGVLKDRTNYCSDAYEAIYCQTCNNLGYIRYNTNVAECSRCGSLATMVVTQSYVTNYFAGLMNMLGTDLRLKVRPIEDLSGDYDLLLAKRNKPALTELNLEQELKRYQVLVFGKISSDAPNSVADRLALLGLSVPVVAEAIYEIFTDPAAEVGQYVMPLRSDLGYLRNALIQRAYRDTSTYEEIIQLVNPTTHNVPELVEQFNNEVAERVDDLISRITNMFGLNLSSVDLATEYRIETEADGSAVLTLSMSEDNRYKHRFSGSRLESLRRKFAHHYPDYTEEQLVALLVRDSILVDIDPVGSDSMNSSAMNRLVSMFDINLDGMSSPISRNMSLSQYASIFNIDSRVGSQGNLFNLDLDAASVLVQAPRSEAIAISLVQYVSRSITNAMDNGKALRFVLLVPNSLEDTETGTTALVDFMNMQHTSYHEVVSVPGDTYNTSYTLIVAESPRSRQINTFNASEIASIFKLN